MTEIFVSYARSTARQAQMVAQALRDLGYGVWRDDELPAHRAYAEVIEERLKAARAVVVIWSAEAVKSQWVRAEADMARGAGTLVQMSLDGVTPPLPFNQIQFADLSGWTGDLEAPGWRTVLGSLTALTGGPGGAASTPPTPQPAKSAPQRSVCVLPFANMSDDAQQEYFSDGITEDIITDLAKVSALYVCARNTAFAFKGKALNLQQVAAELGVSHVLEGSVRKAGNRVRITAQLIDGATGGHVWAERYDRNLDDIFALQDEISQAIVAALKLRLLPEEKKAIERRGTDNIEAYNLVLMARQYRITGNEGDPRREETIIRLCRKAVELDPNYARAWVMIAASQRTLFRLFGNAETGAAAVDEALRLDPDLAEAHSSRAARLAEEGHVEPALAEVTLALGLDPDSWDVNSNAGFLYLTLRRFEEAVVYYEAATRLNDASFSVPGMLASCYQALGDTEGARRAARVSLARAEKVLAHDRGNGTAIGAGVTALAALGEGERAREWLARALMIDPDNLVMGYNLACAFAAHLGDIDTALDLMERVLAHSTSSHLRHVAVDVDMDALREHPRFQAMLAAAEARLAQAEPQ